MLIESEGTSVDVDEDDYLTQNQHREIVIIFPNKTKHAQKKIFLQ